MGRPTTIDHEAFLRLFDEIGVVKEAARRFGIHEQSAHRILRQSRGQCSECPTPVKPSQRWCSACRERIRAQENTRTKDHLRQGVCVKCDEPIVFGRSRRYCAEHVTALVDYMREHRRKRVVNTTGTTLEAEKESRVLRDYGEGGLETWRRDKGCCVLCDVSYADRMVVIHHLDRDRSHNMAENLVCLCYTCHRLAHSLSEHPPLLRFLDWFHRHYPGVTLPQKAQALLSRRARAEKKGVPAEPELFAVP